MPPAPTAVLRCAAVHYENNWPFAAATELVREVQISHWGNVYFEESYSLVGCAGLCIVLVFVSLFWHLSKGSGQQGSLWLSVPSTPDALQPCTGPKPNKPCGTGGQPAYNCSACMRK